MARNQDGSVVRVDERGLLARFGRPPERIGAKAEGLRFLATHGFEVPVTLAVTWDAEAAADSSRAARASARAACAHRSACTAPLAVRSSANIEDDPEHSFAGQFESILDVTGEDELADAISQVWQQAHSERVHAYAQSAGVDPDDIKIAVIVQEQVPAEFSGVAFGKNPLTGLDEVIVEAVRGSGERLGREGVTPSRWVWKWGEFIDEDDREGVGPQVAEKVARGTREIQKAYGAPVDVEWCWDGSKLWWVQVREITALKVAQIYSNRISREVLPGLIKPLVWSVNTRLVNGAWVALITEIIGPNDIAPRSLSRTFYYRAYFDMGTFGRIFDAFGMPRESLEILMGMESEGEERPSLKPSVRGLRHLPRLTRFAWEKLRFSGKIETYLDQSRTAYDSFGAEDAASSSDERLLERIEDLFRADHEAAYFNIVTPLLTQFYSRRFNSKLESAGIDPGEFDTRGLAGEFDEVDPARGMVSLLEAYQAATPAVRELVDAGDYDALRESAEATEFVAQFDAYLQRFGHLGDSGNDFASPPWSERPQDVLRSVGAQSYASESERPSWETVDLSSPQRRGMRRAYERARRFEWYREAVGSVYTKAYGLFRVYFLEAGRRLAKRGTLAHREDVFFLYRDELADVLLGNADFDAAEVVEGREAEFEYARDLIPPETVFGDEPEPIEPGEFTELSGTPTSRGQYRGRAVQVSGLSDGERLRDGDVLFVPFTDVAWTPLFARAGAVVAESGGFLSHSSIVARERGIPAVVSVSGATQVPEGVEVLVDGYAGTVKILEETEDS
jgi:pyruvate,water dikinase